MICDWNGIKWYINALVESGDSSYVYREVMSEIFRLYNASYIWKDLIKTVKNRDKHQCRICGKEILKGILKGICHHKGYDNWGKGNQEEIDDIIYVCFKCHNDLHRSGDIQVPFWARRNLSEIRENVLINLNEIG